MPPTVSAAGPHQNESAPVAAHPSATLSMLRNSCTGNPLTANSTHAAAVKATRSARSRAATFLIFKAAPFVLPLRLGPLWRAGDRVGALDRALGDGRGDI